MTVQVYKPPSDIFREVKVCSIEVLAALDTTVESGNTIFMLGSTTRLSTTLAEHCIEYFWPAMDTPVVESLTFGAGRAKLITRMINAKCRGAN